jgi:hypothetical protein
MRELWHEMAYVEFTANYSNNTGAATDVVSAGSITYGGFPVVVEFGAPRIDCDAGGTVAGPAFYVDVDGTSIGVLVATGAKTTKAERRFTPSAAAHTIKIRGIGTGGGLAAIATAGAGGAGVYLPGYIRVWQKGGA